jgi:hypothetical protein
LNFPTDWRVDLWRRSTGRRSLHGLWGKWTRCGLGVDRLSNGGLFVGSMLIIRDGVSGWCARGFGTAKLLKKIVNRLALGVDDG